MRENTSKGQIWPPGSKFATPELNIFCQVESTWPVKWPEHQDLSLTSGKNWQHRNTTARAHLVPPPFSCMYIIICISQMRPLRSRSPQWEAPHQKSSSHLGPHKSQQPEYLIFMSLLQPHCGPLPGGAGGILSLSLLPFPLGLTCFHDLDSPLLQF